MLSDRRSPNLSARLPGTVQRLTAKDDDPTSRLKASADRQYGRVAVCIGVIEDEPEMARLLSASRTMCYAAVQSQLFQDTIAKPFELSVLLDSVGRLVREQHITG